MSNSYAINCQNFSFAYPRESFTLAPINWQVVCGSLTMLLGRTGSGKTTLLKSLVPALAPRGEKQGGLELFGCPLEDYGHQEACSMVGYVPQNPEASIVCHTVLAELAFGLENLGLSQSEMTRRIAEITAFFGMEPLIHKETALLSGGQRQMVALASVLVMRPKLLLLDEPFSQLDPVAAKTFAGLLFRINKELGITIVVATHDPSILAPYASEAVMLSATGIAPQPLEAYRFTSWCPPVKVKQEGSEEVVSVREAWFRYEKASPWVIRGATDQLCEGQAVVLVGSNGAGKTTHLQLVAGIQKPILGKVKNRLSGRQAYLPQNPSEVLVCDSVKEELQEWQNSAGYSSESIDKMLARLNLTDRQDLHPMDLSGGEQQKLALGKLLLTNPSLLLLDEPTKGLDWETKLSVVRLLKQAQQEGVTILAATHDMACAAVLADRIWLMFDGQITSDESPADFFNEAIFYQLYQDMFTHAVDEGALG